MPTTAAKFEYESPSKSAEQRNERGKNVQQRSIKNYILLNITITEGPVCKPTINNTDLTVTKHNRNQRYGKRTVYSDYSVIYLFVQTLKLSFLCCSANRTTSQSLIDSTCVSPLFSLRHFYTYIHTLCCGC